ncbi:hypothetical protein P280DRAFT_96701 [Massarina eburnea CBS 473.64]|uniref:THO complex subunit 2 n=1 Tax=Massarina eburnea CBS 473.64 TaxID=1395130 RepID=A0A6A6RV01_9PLEO|nr:hypothetical protein P280DRAFT_96701 [Massarina eburnea CBS 473.64]
MAPGPKRKRGEGRNYSQDEDTPHRPSPHRPQPMRDSLNRPHPMDSSRGGRRGSRNNNRGPNNGPQSPGLAQPSPTAMSPPANALQPNRPAPATPSTPVPMRVQTPKKPQLDEDALEYLEANDFLTVERVTNWNAEARDAVVQAAISAQKSGNGPETARIYNELIEASIRQYMDQVEIGLMVRDMVHGPSDESVPAKILFLDCVSTLTIEFKGWEHLKPMLKETDIPLELMREILEAEQLVGLGLVKSSFKRIAVRKTTDLIYRTANYNLLREESEGFSKLMTEYFTTVNTEAASAEVCRETYRRVTAFIGSFDLDVGRTLDVTLDVFANVLVKHCKFFIKYLRGSAWWPELQGIHGVKWQEPIVQTLPGWALPESELCHYTDEEKEVQLRLREERDMAFWKDVNEAEKKKSGSGLKAFFLLGARKITETKRTENNTSETDKTETEDPESRTWTEEWIAKTGTLPPRGNDVAAQLLGFKFQFYANPDRDPGDTLPDNLIYLAALLIKIGFISILDLWPHLYPTDETMSQHKAKLQREKREREMEKKGRGKANALEMAGALPDDTPQSHVSRLRESASKAASNPESEQTTPSQQEDEANTLPEPVDQKVALLRSLLCIGAIPEALFIIGKFPWFLDLYPDLHTYVFRLAHHMLDKVYDFSRPVPLEKIPCVAKGTTGNALPRTGDFTPRRTLRWPKPDLKDAGDGIDYRFYWEDWVDSVPICQTVDDVFSLCSTLLGLVGPECGKDITLMTKLTRIGKKSLTDDPSAANTKRWLGLSASFLAPALTFTGQNPGVVNETWELLKHFDTAERYTIYHTWFRTQKPAMREAFREVTDETKRLLSRVSATNTRPMGKAMAKLACACPGTVFEHTLRQGQSYINMIDALVECSRYLTHLGYDCLTWILVDSLLQKDKDTLQGDGMLVKAWLKNTAIFIGKVYRRYSYMNVTPVLQLVKEQVFRTKGDLFMLVVLEQLLMSMGGIGLSGALTEARVLALSAGPTLRSYVLEHHLGDKRHDSKFASRRLLRCLDPPKDSNDPALATEILIALAQQVMTYPFRPELETVPNKIVFTNYDKLRSNFAQFIEFLRENLSVKEFDEQTPSVVELISDFCLDPNVAFHISRESIAAKVNAVRLKDASPPNGTATNGDTVMGGTEPLAITNGVATPATNPDKSSSDEPDVEMKDAASATVSNPPHSNPEIGIIANQLKTTLPDQYGTHTFLNFFVTFWVLDLKDVLPIEFEELKTQYEDAKKFVKSHVNVAGKKLSEPQNFSLRQSNELCDKLSDEYEESIKTSRLAQHGLLGEMHHWFGEVAMISEASTQLHNRLLQDCFFPRIRMSLQDAQFSSAMLFFMHRTGAPIFRLSKFLDQLFIANKLANMIVMMSEDEARCFGRFLNDILRELQRWHEDKKLYEKHAVGDKQHLLGFARNFNADGTPSAHLDHDQFRALHHKWHSALCTALKNCLKSRQDTELRNCFNTLKAVAPAFPKVDHMANDLRQIIEDYSEHEKRDDVRIAASSILFEFKRSEKLLKTEAFFRTGIKPAVSEVASRTTSEQPKTPRPTDAAAKKLNAGVPVFKPKHADVNGQSKPASAKNPPDEKKPPPASAIANAAPRVNGGDVTKLSSGPNESNTARGNPGRPTARPTFPQQSSAPVSSVPPRPDSRSTNQAANNNRAAHALPIRPDALPPRPRQPERPNDRGAEYRASTSNDYGRLDRGREVMPERELTPGRRRSRSPLRGPNVVPDRRSEWGSREVRDYEDRALRPPPRDVRPPGRGTPYGDSPRDPRDRDGRDQRDYRERDPSRDRPDPRALPHPSLLPHSDGRGRVHANPMGANDPLPPRREMPLNALHGDRGGPLPPRPSVNASPVSDRTLINPERAALINDDRPRMEPPRHDRDARNEGRNDARSDVRSDVRRDELGNRRDRGPRPQSRPQSPRRDERSSASYQGSEPRRDYREERPPSHTASRDRREEAPSMPPTGPRSGRDAAATSQVSRDMFQPSGGSRGRAHPSQDPNYGRLNQPIEATPPSGPRHPASDKRDAHIHTPTAAPPTAPASQQPGVHPSRMSNIRGPPLQTDIPPAPPSGPRGSARTPQQPIPSPSTPRHPPTGPASTDRGSRHTVRGNLLQDIQSVLTPGATNSRPAAPPAAAAAVAAAAVAAAAVERPPERSSRRTDPSRRDRSRTPDRTRGGGEDRSRGEKRDRSRRDPQAEPREAREPRGSRDGRERSDRDRDRGGDREHRSDDRDRRSRGTAASAGAAVPTEDTRGDRSSEGKRRREAGDQPHGETKRSRR